MDALTMAPERAGKVELSSPILELDCTCLVRPSLRFTAWPMWTVPRFASLGVRNHLSTLALSRILKHAELFTAETPDATFGLLRSENFDAMVSVGTVLLDYSTKLPGSRVLEDRYGVNLGSIVVAKGRAGQLAYLTSSSKRPKRRGWYGVPSGAPGCAESR
jgi:polar amino acid transport system substrate-binding protein